MADYEVLAPGGHAHLVSDVKSYADRAGGKGTTQLADGSVTRDKLADGVTDRIDAMRDRCDPLVGNHFFNELAESTVLTTDDAYTAPPKGVEVFGKSTQDGTPTPDAPVPIESVDDLTLNIVGKNLCGGSALLSNIQTAMPTATTGSDTDGDYVRFTGAMATLNGKDIATGMFKASTQYTVILKYANESSGTITQIFVAYTDGTSTLIQKSDVAANTVTTVAFTTAANKTVKSLQAKWQTGTTRLYYDSCGIFEGVLTADQFEPYVGQSVEIPLGNNSLRSLPDGTRDELTLSYVAPSTEHEGWGVYSKTLVQRVWHVDDVSALRVNSFNASSHYITYVLVTTGVNTATGKLNVMSSSFVPSTTLVNGGCYVTSVGGLALFCDTSWASQADAQAALVGVTLDYSLATPITHDLGTVELPVNPAPDLTAWADGGSAQPTMSMSYEQDINIVIARLEAAIADLATA